MLTKFMVVAGTGLAIKAMAYVMAHALVTQAVVYAVLIK
jgi:hypothetical protein